MVLLGKPLQYVLFRYRSLGISKTRELWSSKAAFIITFFVAVNRHYDHKQRTVKHRNSQNGSKSTNHKQRPFQPVEVNLRGPQRWLVSDIFLKRGSKCTNHRKTILSACFLRGHLNLLFSLFLCPFSCPYFVAAGRRSLDKIWRRCFEERVDILFKYVTVPKTYKCMHTLLAVGPH